MRNLPLEQIYDKALIGFVYSWTNPECFSSQEDGEEPIPAYDLDMIAEIHFGELRKEMPDEDPDELRIMQAEELDLELAQKRAIYLQDVVRRTK